MDDTPVPPALRAPTTPSRPEGIDEVEGDMPPGYAGQARKAADPSVRSTVISSTTRSGFTRG